MNEALSLARVGSELQAGMALAKCRQCGCMQDALRNLQTALPLPGTQEAAMLRAETERWLAEIQPIKYACLGCAVCIAATAGNLFAQAFPEAADGLAPACGFDIRPGNWPVVAGEYLLPGNGSGPVAVSTLGSLDLPQQLAALRPQGLAIAGKTETENIGLDKVIKNTIANPALRYLVLAGHDAEGHYPGRTLLALAANGVDDRRRVIGSPGKRPVLRNVTRQEIEAFRQQVQIVDLIGCEDGSAIAARVAELAAGDGCADPDCACHSPAPIGLTLGLTSAPVAAPLAAAAAEENCTDPGCACHSEAPVGLTIELTSAPVAAPLAAPAAADEENCADPSCSCHSPTPIGLTIGLTPVPVIAPISLPQAAPAAADEETCADPSCACHSQAGTGVPAVVAQAPAPASVELDRAGYFVVILQRERDVIVVEHYGYDNTLRHVVEGQDARSIYWTAIENGWLSQLSHAAYLGKELAKAELALKMGFKYVQDGA